MKYWGRCLLVYVTITAVLYGTNSVQPSVSHTRRRGQEDWPQDRPYTWGRVGQTADSPIDQTSPAPTPPSSSFLQGGGSAPI